MLGRCSSGWASALISPGPEGGCDVAGRRAGGRRQGGSGWTACCRGFPIPKSDLGNGAPLDLFWRGVLFVWA